MTDSMRLCAALAIIAVLGGGFWFGVIRPAIDEHQIVRSVRNTAFMQGRDPNVAEAHFRALVRDLER